MKKRKFFKTVVKVEVLSEDVPVEFNSLRELGNIISDGDCVGKYNVTLCRKISAKNAVKKLKELGSSPSFFNLHPDGKDIM